jgi:ABC-type tungstate transport system permease subunit
MKKINLLGLTQRVSKVVLLVALAWGSTLSVAQSPSIVMASTTSTEQSGLFSHLLPEFKKATGIEAKVVAQGKPLTWVVEGTRMCCLCTIKWLKKRSSPKALY